MAPGCTTCAIAKFETSEEWKEHHKSDFHRYNLRRKVAELGPISEERFNRKLELLQLAGTVAKGEAHLKKRADDSLRPPQNVTTRETEPHRTTVGPYDPCMSFFDNTTHSSPEEALAYMERTFAFFLPERNYVENLEGLMRCLGERLWVYHQCLYCERCFSSLYAVRNHMIDSGHTMLAMSPDELEEEVQRFYDFSSSYKELLGEVKKVDSNRPLCSTDDVDDEPKGGDAAEDGGEEGEWEDVVDDSEDEFGSKNETWDKVVKHLGLNYASITDGGNLRLPTGKEVASRQVAYVYRQRFGRKPEDVSKAVKDSLENRTKLLAIQASTGSSVARSVASRQRQSARWERYWSLHPQTKKSHMVLSKRDVQLGVKHNVLIRHIRRHNLVII